MSNCYKFFPYVHLDDFSPFLKKKIDRYVIDFSHYQYLRELESVSRKFRRSKQTIEYHCRSGITKEVAFAIINGLNPLLYIDFEVHGGADKYDLNVGKSKIDVTTATRIIGFKENNNGFDLAFGISRDKYESIKNRCKEKYLANEIAFLKQNNHKIYYLGQINKDKFLKLNSTLRNVGGKNCVCFYVRGKKKQTNPLLPKEIILG